MSDELLQAALSQRDAAEAEVERLRSEVERALLFLDGYRSEGRTDPPDHGDCVFCFDDCQRGLEILESLVGAHSGEKEEDHDPTLGS